jgi:hypothetical protein
MRPSDDSRRWRLALAGGVLALLGALFGGYAVAMLRAGAADASPPPLAWPQSAFLPLLVAAVLLALVAGPLLSASPRAGGLLGLGGVVLGALAFSLFLSLTGPVLLIAWLVLSAPTLAAALMALRDARYRQPGLPE